MVKGSMFQPAMLVYQSITVKDTPQTGSGSHVFQAMLGLFPSHLGVQKKTQLKPIFEGRGPQNKAEIPIKQGAPFGFQVIEKTSPNNAF